VGRHGVSLDAEPCPRHNESYLISGLAVTIWFGGWLCHHGARQARSSLTGSFFCPAGRGASVGGGLDRELPKNSDAS